MGLHFSSLPQLRRTLGSSGEVDEAPLPKRHAQLHSQLRGDDNHSVPNKTSCEQSSTDGSHKLIAAAWMLSRIPVGKRWMPVVNQ